MPIEPVDPDVDFHVPQQRVELTARVLVVIALGGGLGGLARFGVSGLVPGMWGTFVVNIVGCALIGPLMVLAPRWHPLARPFLGVGVLGGFTTFSAYSLDIVHAGVAALLYLGLTLVLGLAATGLTMTITRKVIA